MKRLVPLLAGVVAMFSPALMAASLDASDCHSPSSELDKLICHDAELVVLNKQLSGVYQQALTQSMVSEADVMKETQKNWLATRHLCLKHSDPQRCLVDSYRSRLQSLKEINATVLPPLATYSFSDLKEARFKGIEDIGTAIKLQHGLWAGEPYQPGGTVMPQVILLDDIKAVGPLTPNNHKMAAVLLNYSPGGTGQFLYLAVVDKQSGHLNNIATAFVGDRFRVKDLKIVNKKIILDVIQPGKNDPACCPGDVVRHIWHLNKQNELIEEPRLNKVVRLTPDILSNTQWQLESWRYGDPVSADSDISLRYVNGRFMGNIACNQYTVTVKSKAQPGFIDVLENHVSVTEKQCANPLAAEQQQRYLEQLGGVSQFTYFAGKLALSYRVNGQFGVMIYSQVPLIKAK
ncbi:META domain-containing protein [Photobacterium leiognathi]|uniref:META domain-containing protein n=1 Tax=Photobacterium leiognathi TaxID=553611 RepID=UPI0029823F69|nr:META domain-containing protein [Photobacterium leiognathi]